jgi:hypothetical protein
MKIKFYYFLIFILFCSKTSLLISESQFIEDFSNKLEESRIDFEDAYFNFLKEGSLDCSYNGNLIFHTNTEDDFRESGVILLGLVKWLENRNDKKSSFVLSKLNEFLCLRLYQFTCSMEMPVCDQKDIWETFYRIFNFEVSSKLLGANGNPENKKEYPFRTALTKISLFLLIVNSSGSSYIAKKENLIASVESVRKDIFDLNKTLGSERIDTATVVRFVNLIEAYSIKEPLIQPRSIKRILLWSAIVLVIVLIALFLCYKFETWGEFKKYVGQLAEKIGEFFGQSLVKGAIKEACDDKGFQKIHNNSDFQKALEVVGNNIISGAGAATERGISKMSQDWTPDVGCPIDWRDGTWRPDPNYENIKKDFKFGLKGAGVVGAGLLILKFLVWFL